MMTVYEVLKLKDEILLLKENLRGLSNHALDLAEQKSYPFGEDAIDFENILLFIPKNDNYFSETVDYINTQIDRIKENEF